MIFNTAIEKRIHFEEDESKWIRFLFTRQVVYLMIISLHFL